MNSATTNSAKVKLIAGAAALVATMLTAGATLALADSYARTGVDGQVTLAGDCAARNSVLPVVSSQG